MLDSGRKPRTLAEELVQITTVEPFKGWEGWLSAFLERHVGLARAEGRIEERERVLGRIRFHAENMCGVDSFAEFVLNRLLEDVRDAGTEPTKRAAPLCSAACAPTDSERGASRLESSAS
jgi:hypothetical protein